MLITENNRRRNEIMAEIQTTIVDLDCYAIAHKKDNVDGLIIGFNLLKELERQLWSRYAQVPIWVTTKNAAR